jgi:hypothetical protein
MAACLHELPNSLDHMLERIEPPVRRGNAYFGTLDGVLATIPGVLSDLVQRCQITEGEADHTL